MQMMQNPYRKLKGIPSVKLGVCFCQALIKSHSCTLCGA